MYFLARLLKALNSDSGPWQLAFAIALGMIIGLTPWLRLHNLIIVFVVLLFRINLSMFLFCSLLFSGLAYLLDPTLISLGEMLLTHEALQGLWTAFYGTGIGRASQFNHTLTMGSLALSVLLFIPVVLVCKWLIVQYREKLMNWILKLKIVEFIRGSRIYQLYQQLEG